MVKDTERDISQQNETEHQNERFVTFGLKTNTMSSEKRKQLLDVVEQMFEEDFGK